MHFVLFFLNLNGYALSILTFLKAPSSIHSFVIWPIWSQSDLQDSYNLHCSSKVLGQFHLPAPLQCWFLTVSNTEIKVHQRLEYFNVVWGEGFKQAVKGEYVWCYKVDFLVFTQGLVTCVVGACCRFPILYILILGSDHSRLPSEWKEPSGFDSQFKKSSWSPISSLLAETQGKEASASRESY